MSSREIFATHWESFLKTFYFWYFYSDLSLEIIAMTDIEYLHEKLKVRCGYKKLKNTKKKSEVSWTILFYFRKTLKSGGITQNSPTPLEVIKSPNYEA